MKNFKTFENFVNANAINEADVEYEKIESNPELYDIMMKAVAAGYKHGMNAIKRAESGDHTSMGGKFTYGFRDGVADMHARVYVITELYQEYLDKCVEYNDNLASHLRQLETGKSYTNMNAYKTAVESKEAEVREYAKKVMRDSF